MASILLAPPHHRILPRHPLFSACTDSRLKKRNKRISSFNHRTTASVPLHHHHLPAGAGDSFDRYMEEKGRVIRAIFPEKSTTLQLNQEEWRVKMAPIQALFLTFQPVLDIEARCISNEEDYPPEIPRHVTKILEVNITRWELQGLDANYIPSDFNMKGKGALYMETKGSHSWLKNQIDLSLSLVISPLLAWVPQYVLQSILHSILINYLDDINKGFAVRLLADYDSFKRNRHNNNN